MQFFFTVYIGLIAILYAASYLYVEAVSYGIFTRNVINLTLLSVVGVGVGVAVDWLVFVFASRKNINKKILIIGLVLLIIAISGHFVADVVYTATSPTHPRFFQGNAGAIKSMVSDASTKIGLILGLIVSLVIAPLLFRANIPISIVFFVLGLAVQYEVLIYFAIPVYAVIYIIVALVVRSLVGSSSAVPYKLD